MLRKVVTPVRAEKALQQADRDDDCGGHQFIADSNRSLQAKDPQGGDM